MSSRPLGTSEKFMLWIDPTGGLNFVLVARVAGRIEDDAFVRAVHLTQTRHPMLRVRIEERRGGPWLSTEEVPAANVRCVAQANEDWTEAAAAELAQRFPVTAGPLFRATLLHHPDERHTVILTLHHAIADGNSAVIALRHLLLVLARPDSAVGGDAPALRGPLEAHRPPNARGLRGAWAAARYLGREAFAPLGGYPRRMRSDGRGERRPVILSTALAPPRLDALVARARSEGATINSALYAALFQAVAQDVGGEDVPLCGAAAVNLRELMEPPGGADVGLFIATLQTLRRIRSGGGFWPLARALREELGRQLETGAPWSAIAAARLLVPMLRALGRRAGDAPDRQAELFERMPVATFGISNLGQLDFDEVAPFEVESVAFAGKPVVGFFLSSASTVRGTLHWTFVFPDPVVRPERGRVIVDAAVRQIAQAVDFIDGA